MFLIYIMSNNIVHYNLYYIAIKKYQLKTIIFGQVNKW